MRKVVYILFLMSIVLLVAFGTSLQTTKKANFILDTKTKFFVAGKEVKIQFTSNLQATVPQLYIVHSYGKTLIQGTNKNGKLTFKLPQIYSNKTGIVSWFLIFNE